MYREYYGLRESPFKITPDPRYLFFSRKHREAFDHIRYGIEHRSGFIQITGEVGAGKSTLCRAILQTIDDTVSTALILNPVMTPIQLLRSILREFEKPSRGNDRLKLIETLNSFLLEKVSKNETVALFIDEAQDLSPDLLEEIRLLSNLETDDQKLLQIVLIGQPELRTTLARRELRQLSQRITVRYHLGPLEAAETEAYIHHRLGIAGAQGRPRFTPWAIRSIHRRTGGVPRLINALCDKALLCGYVEDRDELGWWQIRRAAGELGSFHR